MDFKTTFIRKQNKKQQHENTPTLTQKQNKKPNKYSFQIRKMCVWAGHDDIKNTLSYECA